MNLEKKNSKCHYKNTKSIYDKRKFMDLEKIFLSKKKIKILSLYMIRENLWT